MDLRISQFAFPYASTAWYLVVPEDPEGADREELEADIRDM